MPAWLDETDGCSVVCPDDVGVLVLNPDSSGKYAGTYTAITAMDGTATGS